MENENFQAVVKAAGSYLKQNKYVMKNMKSYSLLSEFESVFIKCSEAITKEEVLRFLDKMDAICTVSDTGGIIAEFTRSVVMEYLSRDPPQVTFV